MKTENALKWIQIIVLTFSIIMLLVVMSSCSRCVDSHQQLQFQPTYNPTTKQTTLQPQWVTVCDQWEE